jgi:hypothetical protein
VRRCWRRPVCSMRHELLLIDETIVDAEGHLFAGHAQAGEGQAEHGSCLRAIDRGGPA